MKARILGIRVAKNKDTQKYSTALYLDQNPFEDWEKESAEFCAGTKVLIEFYRGKLDAKPGDIVELNYKPGFQGKAQLDDVSVIKLAAEKAPAGSAAAK